MFVPSLLFVGVVVAAVGSLGAPLITSVATTFDVSLSSAQWTLTLALLTGAVTTPVLGRLGSGPHRRAAILGTLGVVSAGGILTALPLSFSWLLLGRAAQGVGLALTSMLMGLVRDRMSDKRSGSTIALLSVASTAGVGVGYPLSGFLAEHGGLRLAYGFAAAMTVMAFAVALRVVPASTRTRATRIDVPGAVLLALPLTLVLVLISETALWRSRPWTAGVLAAIAVVAAGIWVRVELRSSAPLVDLRLFRHRAVVGANVAMFLGGIGMYLLLTLATRYAQTPSGAGYGFGLDVFAAGLVLVPFSVFGFLAGKLVPRALRRVGAGSALTVSALIVLVALALFAGTRAGIVELCAVMAILGFGVGSFSAALPAVVLPVVPSAETSSVMSINQVVRSVGFSFGSAIGGLVLAAGTSPGSTFPGEDAYTSAAWVGVVVTAAAAIVSASVLHGRAIAGHPT
ncbi:MFS transporter [Rhodococcus fascians]|nr:MFS transporter [Rhodococcus fascians]MBM7242299.1 MFS transporter [Rhodococcus fascians]MBY3809524.1 MFS transporter [Rhodococcus fascians]MBY3840447.1 MFS transporter [Rhodococcus fascians]MBY3845861.1 MFS transporter [Rhodococcus fascians]MBY3849925.1 MFS transporter [Rhodococcus fascians]